MFGLTTAPPIDCPGLRWLNVDQPVALKDLRGKLVILDFWTFCCINCMHVLPVLRRIEERWPRAVAVIGVHSPKFAAERDFANVVQAARRYDIRHPIVHDPDMTLWRAYGVRAWPTLVFVAPDGNVIGHLPGEPAADRLVDGIAAMIEGYEVEGILRPADLDVRTPSPGGGRLSFPGKIKPLPGAPVRWAVADAGHHQIALFDDDGREHARFGSGVAGFKDGAATEAAFHSPQGLAADDEAIYVADTGNHAIRRIARSDGRVTTLAGKGRRGQPLPWRGRPGAEIDLASPWDLETREGRLFFANAGTHQLGEMDLRNGTVRALAGTGGESIVDGPAAEAQLAQPSGLALDPTGSTLYFADSETSSVRALDFGPDPHVRTLVGAGLFDFGDANGPFAEARLQHALGLCWWQDGLVVADSYNGRLRRLDLVARTVADVGERHFACDGPLCLPAGEPAGVAAAGPDRLLVADTNNHRIVEIRPATGAMRVLIE